MQSVRQSRVSRLSPWHIPLPCWRHWRFRCCWRSLSHGVQRDHVSQPSKDSQLGISQVSLTSLGPSQLSGPMHSLVLVRTPTPQEAEHSDQSVQQDHCPSITPLPKAVVLHGWMLHILVCTDIPSHGGDSHCLLCVHSKKFLRINYILLADVIKYVNGKITERCITNKKKKKRILLI